MINRLKYRKWYKRTAWKKDFNLRQLKVGRFCKLRDGRVVRITKRRKGGWGGYAYPIWYQDVLTSIPDGCKFKDIIEIGEKKGGD